MIAYAYYVRRTLLGGGEMQAVDEIGPLYLDALTPRAIPRAGSRVLQFLIGLGAIVGGATSSSRSFCTSPRKRASSLVL